MKNASPEGFPCAYGKYELLARIGQGGMAEVFRARLPGVAGFEKILVIKRLLPHLARSASVVEMFVNEAKLAAQVHHRNVVQVFELGQVDEEFYMAMEHVAGTDLRQILRAAAVNSMRLPPWFSVHVVSEVLDGLAFAHELTDESGRPRNVVHRDVTPANIFVSYLGDVKLGDFGVAKDESREQQTRAGTLKGKVPYMSPEQLYGRELDLRSDVFAAGVVLWECLTQRRLFGGRPDIESMNLICYGDRKPPSAFAADVPPELDAVVLQALSADLERRTRTARDLQAQLLEVLPLLRPRVHQHDVRSIVEVVLGNKDPSANTGPKSIHDDSIVKQNFLESTPGIGSNPSRPSDSGSRHGPSTEELVIAIDDEVEESGELAVPPPSPGRSYPPGYPVPQLNYAQAPSSSQYSQPKTPPPYSQLQLQSSADLQPQYSQPLDALSEYPRLPPQTVSPADSMSQYSQPKTPPAYARLPQTAQPGDTPSQSQYAPPQRSQSHAKPRTAQSADPQSQAAYAQQQMQPNDAQSQFAKAQTAQSQYAKTQSTHAQQSQLQYAQSQPTDPRYATQQYGQAAQPQYAQESQYAQATNSQAAHAQQSQYAQPAYAQSQYAQAANAQPSSQFQHSAVGLESTMLPPPRIPSSPPREEELPLSAISPWEPPPAPPAPSRTLTGSFVHVSAPRPRGPSGVGMEPSRWPPPQAQAQGAAEPSPSATPSLAQQQAWAQAQARALAEAHFAQYGAPAMDPSESFSNHTLPPVPGFDPRTPYSYGSPPQPRSPSVPPQQHPWPQQPPPMAIPIVQGTPQSSWTSNPSRGPWVDLTPAHAVTEVPNLHKLRGSEDATRTVIDAEAAGAREPYVTDDFTNQLGAGSITTKRPAPRLTSERPAAHARLAQVSTYEGPHPFFVRPHEGTLVGPISYQDALSVLRFEAHAGRLELCTISGTRQRWMTGDTFAMLTGQEILLDKWADREKELHGAVNGTFAQMSPTALFARITREKPSGRLILVNSAYGRFMRREIVLSEGAPTYIYANQNELQIPDLLVSKNLVAREQLVGLLHNVVLDDRPLEEVVSERTGFELSHYWASFMKERLVELFKWTSGRWVLDTEAPITHTTPFAPSLMSLLPEMVYRAKSIDELRQSLAPHADAPMDRSERFNRGVSDLRLTDLQKKAVLPFGSGRTLGQSVKAGIKEERLSLTMAYILLETELLLRAQ